MASATTMSEAPQAIPTPFVRCSVCEEIWHRSELDHEKRCAACAEAGSTVPNPGSNEALRLGCKCPVLDNACGRGLPNGTFWFTAECPLHAQPQTKE